MRRRGRRSISLDVIHRRKNVQLADSQDTKCKRCKLHKSTKNVCIMGRGNPDGPIMIIGEAPGANEAQTGKPFTGRAGQFMQFHLERLGIEDLCYITNVVKCRPPQNRDPSEDEIKKCSIRYLHDELKIVNPRCVLLLGRIAADFILGKKGWTRNDPMHFQGFSVKHNEQRYIIPINAPLMATWHPAYCIRSGSTSAIQQFKNALVWTKLFIN